MILLKNVYIRILAFLQYFSQSHPVCKCKDRFTIQVNIQPILIFTDKTSCIIGSLGYHDMQRKKTATHKKIILLYLELVYHPTTACCLAPTFPDDPNVHPTPHTSFFTYCHRRYSCILPRRTSCTQHAKAAPQPWSVEEELYCCYHQPHGSIMAKSSATLTLLVLAGLAAGAAAAAVGEDTKLLNMSKIGKGYTDTGEDGGEPFEFEITAAKFSSKVCGCCPILSSILPYILSFYPRITPTHPPTL